jgi:putative transposase
MLSFGELCRLLTLWRNSEEFGFLREAPCAALQHSLRRLCESFKRAFDRRDSVEFPRFHKRGMGGGIRCPERKNIRLDLESVDKDGRCRLPRVKLPKLAWLKFRGSRKIEGEIRNAAITRSGDHWFVSIQTQREVEEPKHPSKSIVGIDAGIVNLATLSDGAVYEPIATQALEAKKSREQRKLSRMKKFSNNWQRQKKKVGRISTKIANVRRDTLQKVSTQVSKNHAAIVIEDLKVSNMTKSAKRTVENPGSNVKWKSGLNRSILRQGWAMFRVMLEYKQSWRGGEVIAVPPYGTSQTCSECRHRSAENRASQSSFRCVECGHVANADVNAAINILRAGHVRLACSHA